MIHKKVFIAIDSGKSYTKGVIRIDEKVEQVIFRTKSQEVQNDMNMDLMRNTDMITIDGKKYLIGESVSEDNTDYELTKHNNAHFVAILLAITKLLDKTPHSTMAKVHLALNLPASIYLNDDKKQSFERYLKNEGRVFGVEVNGKPYAFSIDNVLALPEALGGLFIDMDEYRDKKVTFVDVGSFNMGLLEANRLTPNIDKMISSSHGINMLRATINSALTRNFGVTFYDEDIDDFLQTKIVRVNGIEQADATLIIDNLMRDHVLKMIKFAESRKIQLKSQENVVIVGGGSYVLGKYIKEQLPHASILPLEEAQFANVLSYLQILEAKYATLTTS